MISSVNVKFTNKSNHKCEEILNGKKHFYLFLGWCLFPSKHLLVFKTSQRRLQDMSWRRLQHVFSVKMFYLPRPLEDVLQIRLKDLLKTSCRHLTRRLEDVFKTSWGRLGRQKIVALKTSPRRLENMSWRRLQDVLETNKMFIGNICI